MPLPKKRIGLIDESLHLYPLPSKNDVLLFSMIIQKSKEWFRSFLIGAYLSGSFAMLYATEIKVGPGEKFSRIEEAVLVAKPNDLILVSPQTGNQPYEATHLFISRPQITLKAVSSDGTRVRLSGSGYDYSGEGSIPRAIVQFNKGADGCVVEGFEISEAHNKTHNGAGVRINQANSVTIRDCVIHQNDMGIMSNGDGTPQTANGQLIENCLIYSNGNLKDPGYNHNLYLGGMSVTVRGCEIHSSLTGHNLKSRAHRTSILACYFHDSANREIDLVDDKFYTTLPESDALLAGNVILKSPRSSGNRNVIHFGQDVGNEHDGRLILVHNTIVSSFISPIVLLTTTKARTQWYNNLVWDGGAGQKNQVLIEASQTSPKDSVATGTCNWLSAGFRNSELESSPLQQTRFGDRHTTLPFVDFKKSDLHLASRDSILADQGARLPDEVIQFLGGKLLQYKAPQGSESRPDDDKPDLGAYEYSQSP